MPSQPMATLTHHTYMARCIELAKLGEGYVSPNPLVGCVIVHNHKIIAEGWHKQYGAAHAEVEAIRSLRMPVNTLKESTLYVSLEPCAHFGETPPCAQMIIQQGIPRVVIGTRDLFHLVNGKGIDLLKAAGVEVVEGIMEEECRYLNRRFFCFHEKKRPYIILKWAESADGFIDSKASSKWLTNERARAWVHKWRHKEDAILIGRKTAVKDNPSLTLRNWSGKPPKKILFSPTGKLPMRLNLFSDENNSSTLLLRQLPTEREGAKTLLITPSKDPLEEVCRLLHEEKILSLIVEGGSQTLWSFLHRGLWDEIHRFVGTPVLHSGTLAPTVPPNLTSQHYAIGDCKLFYYKRLPSLSG